MTKTRRGNPTVTIRLSPGELNRLKSLSQERGLSVSLILRESLRLYLLTSYAASATIQPETLPGQMNIGEA